MVIFINYYFKIDKLKIKVFDLILSNAGVTLELFINHDCSVGHLNVI